MKKIIVNGFLLALIYLLGSNTIMAQAPAIEGPTCVLSGAEYQYNLKGNLPQDAKVCITGGTISGTSTSCTNDLSKGYIRIVWNSTKGSISLSSSQGSYSANVSVTVPLQGGTISSSKEQYISYNSSAAAVSCTKPLGGGCSAVYSYQWQWSVDNLNWQNVTGATGEKLTGLSGLTQTIFYRRKTTETVSGTSVYSDAAVVYVSADTKGH